MPPNLLARTKEAFWGLIGPWLFLSISARFLPQTIIHLYRASPSFLTFLHQTLLSPTTLRGALFGHFWAFMGPNVRDNASDKVLPLLDGRTSGGRVVPQPTGPGIGGVVIEIGAATGLWVDVFSDRHLFQPDEEENPTVSVGAGAAAVTKRPKTRSLAPSTGAQRRTDTARTPITKVYGIEPNAAHHAALHRAVEAAGLLGIYEIVPVGIEDLSSTSVNDNSNNNKKKWEGNIPPESVDCIVSVLCLCSIPDPKRHIRELYELLRPGGRWYIYEHVRAEYSWYMQLYQRKSSPFIPLLNTHPTPPCVISFESPLVVAVVVAYVSFNSYTYLNIVILLLID